MNHNDLYQDYLKYGENCVILNNRLTPVSKFPIIPLGKKSRKRLIKRLRKIYRCIFKTLPSLHGDFDGDCLNTNSGSIFEGIDIITPIPFSELRKAVKGISIPGPDIRGNIK